MAADIRATGITFFGAGIVIGAVTQVLGLVLSALHLLTTGLRELIGSFASFGGDSDVLYDISIATFARTATSGECSDESLKADLGDPDAFIIEGRCEAGWVYAGRCAGSECGDHQVIARIVDGRWTIVTGFPTAMCRGEVAAMGAPAAILERIIGNLPDSADGRRALVGGHGDPDGSGIGTAHFGDAPGALGYITGLFGPVTHDSGWTTVDGCEYTEERRVSWSDLVIRFAGDADGRRFVGYEYYWDDGDPPVPLDLRTDRGLGIADSVGSFTALYPDAEYEPSDYYFVPNEIQGSCMGALARHRKHREWPNKLRRVRIAANARKVDIAVLQWPLPETA